MHYLVVLCNVLFKPSHPKISMCTLHTVLCIFRKVLERRICLRIKSLFSSWSFSVFSWPSCLIPWCYCKEKLDASHSNGLIRVKHNWWIHFLQSYLSKNWQIWFCNIKVGKSVALFKENCTCILVLLCNFVFFLTLV